MWQILVSFFHTDDNAKIETQFYVPLKKMLSFTLKHWRSCATSTSVLIYYISHLIHDFSVLSGVFKNCKIEPCHFQLF